MVGAETGSANVMTANVAPVPTAYIDGQIVIIQKAAFDNNGPMTGNIEEAGHPSYRQHGRYPAGG